MNFQMFDLARRTDAMGAGHEASTIYTNRKAGDQDLGY